MSMFASARVMVPISITASMIRPGTTIPEPDLGAGEVAWVSGGNYTIGMLRTYSGSIWGCRTAHSASAKKPDVDALNWYRDGPTNRMAPFDDYSRTKATGTSSLTYVLQPGFLNGLAVYGMEGAAYVVEIRDQPGGMVTRSWGGDLYSQAIGFYELLYTPLVPTVQMSFDDVPLAPAAEVTITVLSGPGERVAIGTIKTGHWRQFIGDSKFGGAQYGAEATRKTFTLRKYFDDGTYDIQRRTSSRNVSCTIAIDAEQAMYANAIMSEIEDVAVPFEATGLPRYGYLNTLGFVTGVIRADNCGSASINLKVEGNI